MTKKSIFKCKQSDLTPEEEVAILYENFGEDSYYPEHLRTATLQQRIFAYYAVRSETFVDAMRKVMLVSEKKTKDSQLYHTAHFFKKAQIVQDLIQFEKKQLLTEIRCKTARFADEAIDALRGVLTCKSAIGRVQAAIALLDVAGVRDDPEVQKQLEDKPLSLLPHDKRMEIIRNFNTDDNTK